MSIDKLTKGDLVVVLVDGSLIAVRVAEIITVVTGYKMAQRVEVSHLTVVEPDGTRHHVERRQVVETTNNYTAEKLKTLYLPKKY
jgi:hypothetical protein